MTTTTELAVTTDATFQRDVLAANRPVLVDFWAQWCPPCHMIVPVLAQIADERPDLRIFKINNDENPSTGRAFQIMSLPTLLLFVDGTPVWTQVGARPKSAILAGIDDALGG